MYDELTSGGNTRRVEEVFQVDYLVVLVVIIILLVMFKDGGSSNKK